MLKKVLFTATIASLALGQSLEDRVEALEYAGYENWFKFSGNLEYRFDTVERESKKAYSIVGFDGSSASRAVGEKETTDHHRLFSELDIEAKPSEKLTFYGRLATTKYFNTLNKGGGSYADEGAFNELSEGAAAGSSRIFLERAFVNYQLMKSLTLSVGRLPTIDGAPKHIPEGRPMMGNYPNLAFAGIFDGLALTYGNMFAGTSFKLRGIYTPFNQRNVGNTLDKLKDGTAGTTGNKVDENTDVYSIMMELEKENLSWAKRVHLIYQYLYFDGLYALNGGTVYTDTAKIESSSSATLGLERHVLNLEVYGIANTGLNIGLSYLKGNTKGSGTFTNPALAAALGGSSNVGTWYGQGNVDKDGDALIANINYTFKSLNNATFGFEYLDTDADAFLYDSASRNTTGFYTARGGDAKHLYWVQPVDRNFKVRVGWQETNNKKRNLIGGYIGPDQEIDDVTTAMYTSLQFFF